jgi:hypothetical protein
MLLAPLLLAFTQPVVAPSENPKDVRKQFIELAAKKDHDGCLALWRANPSHVLGTIDADLEGSLKAREKSAEPDLKKIEEMQARAMWGAEIAFEASGHPILRDYAASFVGWNADDQKSFRAGQAAFGKAMKALDAKDAAAALAAGTQCLQLAAPLGDWWGSAMGYQAIAAAQKVAGNHEKALEAAAFARLLYHDLGLVSDEYEALGMMIDASKSLGRLPRARASLDRALELAKQLKDADGEKRLTDLAAELAAKDAAGPAKK